MRHVPVLLTEVVDGLDLKLGARVVDCTLGDGGHSEAILAKIGPKGKLLGIDADPESLMRAKQYLYNFNGQSIFVRDNFVNLAKILQENKFISVDAILMDLGWSSPQFSERGRGFSFQQDEPLDMQYAPPVIPAKAGMAGKTASAIVNESSEAELAKIFKSYGEEKFFKEITRAIIAKRQIAKIERTSQLVAIILQVYREKLHTDKEIPWTGGTHPATQVFQALRIAVNDELGVLKSVLPQAVESLATNGRLAVITFHSLEDRIVKQYFQKENCKILKVINKKPIEASAEEVKNNPRSRSAKLRIVEKL
ncbi:MAG: 16S rRNA (cytosine(1402)-N(4))-methyltransferase RsmH [Candidatus Magasanikbacteria bacterium]